MKYEYLHTHRSADGDLCDAVLIFDVEKDGTNVRLLDPICPGCDGLFTKDEDRAVEDRCAQEIADRMDEKREYEREMMGSAYGAEEWL